MNLEKAVQCYLACEIDRKPQLVRIAACILSRYVFEMHRYGEFQAACDEINKLMKRFRLGDYACALFANYPPKKNHNRK